MTPASARFFLSEPGRVFHIPNTTDDYAAGMVDFKFARRISHVVHGICEPGDTKPLELEVAERYAKRGWGEIVEAPKPKKTAARKKAAAASDGD